MLNLGILMAKRHYPHMINLTSWHKLSEDFPQFFF
jgi:hypothetical protein